MNMLKVSSLPEQVYYVPQLVMKWFLTALDVKDYISWLHGVYVDKSTEHTYRIVNFLSPEKIPRGITGVYVSKVDLIEQFIKKVQENSQILVRFTVVINKTHVMEKVTNVNEIAKSMEYFESNSNFLPIRSFFLDLYTKKMEPITYNLVISIAKDCSLRYVEGAIESPVTKFSQIDKLVECGTTNQQLVVSSFFC